MGIKDEFNKIRIQKEKEVNKNIGSGLIKVEIKDGHIEATSQLNMPHKTLVMSLLVLEALQRSIVEEDKNIKELFGQIRKLKDDELMKLIKENSALIKNGSK